VKQKSPLLGDLGGQGEKELSNDWKNLNKKFDLSRPLQMTGARITNLFVEQKSPLLGDLGGQGIWKQKRTADEKT
jgi:hypothetical protein